MINISDDYKVEVIYEQTGTTQRPGGQHAGNPATSVRVTHIETGLMTQCGFHSSQFNNKQTAMEMLEWGLTSIIK
jgi:protein subunit release factor B